MTVALIIAVPGVLLLLLASFAGLTATWARTSAESLVAPRNAEFGEISRRARAEATREQARADLKGLTSRRTGPMAPIDDAIERSAQRAA
jgi:hypothetical protein